MKTTQPIAMHSPGVPVDLSRDLHNFIQNQTKETQERINKEFEKIKHFAEVQNELTEFRLFLSLHADKKEIKRVADKLRQNRELLWEDLLKKNKGDAKKARDFFYE